MTTEENRNIQKLLAELEKKRSDDRRAFGIALAFIGLGAMLFFSIPLGLVFLVLGAAMFILG